MPKSTLMIPCGRCLYCRSRYAREWSIRCYHEFKLHEETCMLNLDFRKPHTCPSKKISCAQCKQRNSRCSASLDYRDFQLFMKRFRKAIFPKKVRFFVCGEYGDKFGRPHYHAIIFGYSPPTTGRFAFRVTPSGSTVYRSAPLEAIWQHGRVVVGEVNFKSISYVARYVLKKFSSKGYEAQHVVPWAFDNSHPDAYRVPAFLHMSTRPGIGALFCQAFISDIYPRDKVVIKTDDGVREYTPPRYYDKLYARHNICLFWELQAQRYKRFMEKAANESPQRIAAKGEYLRLTLSGLPERDFDIQELFQNENVLGS